MMINIEEISIATDMEFTMQVLINFNITDAGVLARFRGIIFSFCFEFMLNQESKIFVEEGVSHRLFEFLSESEQRELMPKLLDRLNFRKGLVEFKNLNANGKENELEMPTEEIVIMKLLYCLLLLYNLFYLCKYAQNLSRLLTKSTKGKLILQHFEKQKSLNDAMRSKLVDIIADQIILKGIPKGNATASKMAKEICELFPSENEVRFIAPIKMIQFCAPKN